MPRPHGGSVNNKRPHERTCESVLKEMKLKVIQNSSGKVYSENVNKNSINAAYQGILNARDKRQVKNLANIERKKYRVSHDEIYGSLQIAYHVNDFIFILISE